MLSAKLTRLLKHQKSSRYRSINLSAKKVTIFKKYAPASADTLRCGISPGHGARPHICGYRRKPCVSPLAAERRAPAVVAVSCRRSSGGRAANRQAVSPQHSHSGTAPGHRSARLRVPPSRVVTRLSYTHGWTTLRGSQVSVRPVRGSEID